MDVNNKDQNRIEKNMYKNIFLLLSSNALAMKVPMGMEITTGVKKATPNNPYLRQILTNFLDPGEKTFLAD